MSHIIRAMLAAIAAGLAIAQGSVLDSTIESVAPVPVVAFQDEWATERRDLDESTRLALGIYDSVGEVDWIACERDAESKQDTIIVGLGSRVGVFRTARLWGWLLNTLKITEVPAGVDSPYSHLVALKAPVSPDLARRLLDTEPSGSCGV